ncbi:MAG: peptidylprolyl isomerase [Candidatus Cloacimonetes bacterium]|nr:peptidylprolyl isomerase [Candidatus Cloacimonadota bacterium]
MICYADTEKTVRVVIFETNQGNIEMELYPEVAPGLVENFLKLSSEGFYNDTYFHRVIPQFMIQGGDPNTKDGNRANDGQGGPGYRLPDEISAKAFGFDTLLVKDSFMANQVPRDHPVSNMTVKELLENQGYTFNDDLPSLPNAYSYISMANAGPNTNGSQFFIITAEDGAPWLDGKHTVIGKVVNGMDVVHKIENLPRDSRDNPLEDNQAIVNNVTIK